MSEIFRKIRLTLLRLFRKNTDLIAIWVLFIMAQAAMPVNNYLSNDDLTPWMMLSLAVVSYQRGRRIGGGPHPMLVLRTSWDGRLFHAAVRVIIPIALLLAFDGAMSRNVIYSGAGAAGFLAVAALLAMGRGQGQSAWDPPGIPGWVVWPMAMFAIYSFVGMLGGIAALDFFPDYPIFEWLGVSGLLGLGFLSVGLASGRVQHIRQRRSAGRTDGKRARIDLFPFLLAFFGPSLGLLLLYLILGGLDFTQSYVISLHVLVWASVIWPRLDPVAAVCVLHDVLPAGGADKKIIGEAQPFHAPPQGSLRLTPLRLKRTRVVHPWVIPVQGARIEGLDDPIKPLWQRPAPFLPFHLLGSAAFEPDPAIKETQTDIITLRLKSQEGSATSSGSGFSARRMVILRAYPAPGSQRKRRIATYRWETPIVEETIQVLDENTESATLMTGDVLVMSAEGVARAYEVEIGAPLFFYADALAFRPPQLEDYVKAG